MLFGSAVGFGCAPVQTEHELQVLVGLLLVRQRPVVGATVAPPAAPQRAAGRRRGPRDAGGAQQVEEAGQ